MTPRLKIFWSINTSVNTHWVLAMFMTMINLLITQWLHWCLALTLTIWGWCPYGLCCQIRFDCGSCTHWLRSSFSWGICFHSAHRICQWNLTILLSVKFFLHEYEHVMQLLQYSDQRVDWPSKVCRKKYFPNI